MDAADTNDDSRVNVADTIRALGHLFGGDDPLPEPFASCGVDPSGDDLDCVTYSPCE
jgi:hypothetical protein